MAHDGMRHHNPLHEEASVVSAARSGDNAAFDVLATKYRRRILNTVGHITGSLDDAEDVTQEALLKAFVKIGGFRGTCSFSTWLTRIAIWV
jgi:RNA polymerase sigma-70 factor (ECF subfamily)